MKRFFHTGRFVPWSPSKDPDDIDTYRVDWSRFLIGGELISSSSWIGDAGLVLSNETHSPTMTQVQVSGGTVNTQMNLTNRIVTTDGNQYDRSMKIPIRNK